MEDICIGNLGDHKGVLWGYMGTIRGPGTFEKRVSIANACVAKQSFYLMN